MHITVGSGRLFLFGLWARLNLKLACNCAHASELMTSIWANRLLKRLWTFLWPLCSADSRASVQSIDIVAEPLQNVSGSSHHCWVISYCEAPLLRKSLQWPKMTYCLESHSYLSFLSFTWSPFTAIYTVRVTHTLGWYKLLPTRPG